MTWDDSDPGVGDTTDLRATADALKTEAIELVSTAQAIGAAIVASHDSWQGTAGDAWRTQLDHVRTGIIKRSDITAETATILTTFVDALDDIIADTATAKVNRDAALEAYQANELQRSAAQIHEFFTHTCPVGTLPPLASPEYDAAMAKIRALAAERHAAEATCVAALRDTVPASWTAVKNLAGAIRVDPATLTPAAIAKRCESSKPGDAIDTYLTTLSPADAASFWPLLSQKAKDNLTQNSPAIVGNLEGIPYADRHRANVIALKAEKERLEKELSLLPPVSAPNGLTGATRRMQIESCLADIDALQRRFIDHEGPTRTPPEYLVAFSSDNPEVAPGRVCASVGVGDLDTATSVGVFVPGMNSAVKDVDDYVAGASNILSDNPGEQKAMLVFLNYDSPKGASVFSDEQARAGGKRLSSTLDGLQAARGRSTKVHVMAHSYGTTVTAYGLRHRKPPVDSVTLLSSAGIPGDIDADDLGVRPDRVFVTEPAADYMADLGRLGEFHSRQDPERKSFGAIPFGSDGTVLPDGTVLKAVTGHGATPGSEPGTAHLDKGSESLYNLRQIINGNYSQLTPGKYSDPPLDVYADNDGFWPSTAPSPAGPVPPGTD